MVSIIVELLVDSMRCVVVGKDKRCELRRGVDRREDLAITWKDASGWAISGIGGTGDVSGEDLTAVNVEKGVDTFENFVDVVVPTMAGPPPFDNSSVIAVNFEARTGLSSFDDGLYKELHSNRLCPGNVFPFTFPTGFECPCSPLIADNDANAN